MKRTVGDRAFALDAATVVVVSAAICVAADRLAFMTVLVPIALALRMVLFALVAHEERDGTVLEEIPFFALCTALGAFNDWSSVVRYGVYDYTVPSDLSTSSIPVWMLLFWGMILRFMVTTARYWRLGATGARDDRLRIGRTVRHAPVARVAVALALVLGTRQLIYRLYLDPVTSWLPFAVALVAYFVLFCPSRHDRRVMALVAVVGPVVEILYIQVGGLHRYHLGWIFGVPLWIVLWWVLGVVLWKDLSLRAHDLIGRAISSAARRRLPRVRRDA